MVRPSIDFSTYGAWSKTDGQLGAAAERRGQLGQLVADLVGDRRPRCRPGVAVTAMPRLGLPLVRVIEVAGGELLLDGRRRRRAGPAAPPRRGRRRRYDAARGRPTVVDRRADLHGQRRVALGQRAGRDGDAVGAAARSAIAVGVEPGGGQLRRVRGDDDLLSRAPVTLGLADPVDALQLGHHGRAQLVGERAARRRRRWRPAPRTGKSSVLPAKTCGSTPSGSWASIRLSAVCILVDRVVEVGAELELDLDRGRRPRGRSR